MRLAVRWTILVFVACLALPAHAEDGSATAALTRLKAGGVLLLRHTSAPGTGDPPGFRLDDCATQRNLSAEGRREARAIGARLRAEGIPIARVLTSRWCRARDTAVEAFGASRVEDFPGLDSFFADRSEEADRTSAVREAIAGWEGKPGVLAMVTHQVNITALTGIVPAEGEAVVIEPTPDGGRVVGRLRLADG